jgi:predicted Zn-ribbon and HTH transcriptional regulator
MTVRDQIRAQLELRPHTSLQISQAVGIPQSEVAGHLEHLARSLVHQGLALEVDPARCIACEWQFEDRRRFGRPSRCPRCKSERIDPPRFSVRAR